MRKISFILVSFSFLLFNIQLSAQNIIGSSDSKTPISIKETMEDLTFDLSFDFLSLQTINTQNGLFSQLDMGKDFGHNQKVGYPKLPIYYEFIEIPFGANFEIEYNNIVKESYSLNQYGGYKLIPVQKSISKNDTSTTFYLDKDVYNSDKFFGDELVNVEIIGFMGGVRLARLSISPIKYNPVSNSIEIIRSANIKVKFLNADIQKTISLKQIYNNQQSKLLKDELINPKDISAITFSAPINRPLKMIILSDAMFEEALQPFIRWKREKGFEIIELYKGQSSIGTTTTSMKAYLQLLWDNASVESPFADYLLICGDIEQIPAFDATTIYDTPTDLYYAEYTGDILPDVFYGRFSVQTVEQMNSIINKTIAYEKYLMQDTSYLKKTLLVAGSDRSWTTNNNGQMNYLKQYLINNNSTDTLVYYNPSSEQFSTKIRDSISRNGYSLINYSAHCDETGWASPTLTVSNIYNNVNNFGKYPLYINNCCLSNKFNVSECFGESIIRADNKGGIGAIGGSNSTYWDEDFYWSVGSKSVSLTSNYDANNLGAYDRLFHANNEPLNQWYITAGQIQQAGNLAVMKYNSQRTDYYWEIYHLMGDPSLIPYIGLPSTMTNNLPDSLPIGLSNISIQTEPYAFVGISQNGVLLGASQSNANGLAQINLKQRLSQTSYVKFVITKQFSKPIIDSAVIFTPNYPLLTIDSLKYTDNQNNQVTQLKNNEEYFVSFNISNLGAQSINNVKIKAEADFDLLVLDSNKYIGTLAGLSSTYINNAIKIKIEDGALNQKILNYSIKIEGENNYSANTTYNVEVFAPELSIEKLTIITDTSNTSFTNQLLRVSFDVLNKGRNTSALGSVLVNKLSSNLSYTIDSTNVLNPLTPNASTNFEFDLLASSIEELISFRLFAKSGGYYISQFYDSVAINGKYETFETGDLSYFDWINNSSKPWIIEDSLPNVYQGLYSLRSGKIGDSQKTTLKLNIVSLIDDSVSFYFRTSTEERYDIMSFYIDNDIVLKKSGSNNWQKVSFPIKAGSHELIWEYKKDDSDNNGFDVVWIDNIKLPISGNIISLENIQSSANNITIYPNPAKNFINISNLKNKSNIKIFNSIGKLVNERPAIGSEININTSELTNGIYYIVIESENNITIPKKLIIAR